MWRPVIATFLLLSGLLLSSSAAAQTTPNAMTVTPDQISAIRSNCRRDFLLNCSGVPRGGKEAFLCLRNNQGKLSQACGKAVAAVQ